jgi:hypothetical protein
LKRAENGSVIEVLLESGVISSAIRNKGSNGRSTQAVHFTLLLFAEWARSEEVTTRYERRDEMQIIGFRFLKGITDNGTP